MQVLVVEDNAELAANVGDYLDAAGHVVDFARDGQQAIEVAAAADFDVVVLDLALPKVDGIDVCAHLREQYPLMSVLMLTARDTLRDRLDGFAAGADDYLIKPFSLEELLARLTALHRRATGTSGHAPLRVGDLEFDPATRRAVRAGRELDLTPAQQRLLEILMRNADRVVSRRELEAALWSDDPPDGDVLRAHIHLLRKAIDHGHDAKLLHTIRGAGYRLVESDAP